MNEPNSFETRIEKTNDLISFLSGLFPMNLKSGEEEWPRTYEFVHLEKKYKAVFSLFGSFTLLPIDTQQVAGTSPIFYLSLDMNPSQQFIWAKPDRESMNDPNRIADELQNQIRIYEAGISEINSGEK
ncbi:LIC_13241 domain-containing protein [Leptospira sanjuanensis]|uniref:LIC_13241 domain-containing protein n=1 Tax=Leptospira sanjuanensis TaxID=2879643 RepID=UPI001EE8AA1A|nr:hypothetical protein [Leptospira sanjuanensis]MCG6166466.1 hypothetical protein [Leptospira sanjuanensis]